MENDMITVATASKISGYHPERIRELLRRQEIEGVKFGIVWVVYKSSLLEYLEEAQRSEDRRRGPKKRT